MEPLAGIVGLVLLALVLLDVFVALILPATVTWPIRLSRALYLGTWLAWRAPVHGRPAARHHATYLRCYGPLSLFILILAWCLELLVAFALLHWALGSQITTPEGSASFITDLYLSGTTLFTLGMGDVTPLGPAARLLTVIEAAIGLGFLAVVIGYLPVLYQAFAQREVYVTLLSAQAGAPPSAGELLRRYGQDDALAALDDFLHESEQWVAGLLGTHTSHPLLAYYRSQRADQSWLAALILVLDLGALVMVGVPQVSVFRARRAFEIACSTASELCRVFGLRPEPSAVERLPVDERARLRAELATARVALPAGDEADTYLDELRRQYEPYVGALANYFLLMLPPWVSPPLAQQASERAEALSVTDGTGSVGTIGSAGGDGSARPH
jgi:hypothetical protein